MSVVCFMEATSIGDNCLGRGFKLSNGEGFTISLWVNRTWIYPASEDCERAISKVNGIVPYTIQSHPISAPDIGALLGR